jgi:hypothetical protein
MNAPLQAMQVSFADYLLCAHADPQGLLPSIREGGSLPAADRLAIYHQAYRLRLAEALQECFEHTWTYLGDAGFGVATTGYIEATPSVDADLRWYGTGFPAWLARLHPADPEVAELAAMDWALRGAFDAADAPVLDAPGLQLIPAEAWATGRLSFHPSARVILQRFNTLAIWQALDREEAPPPIAALPVAQAVLVWRRNEQPHFMSIGEDAARVLTASLDGLGFAGLCEEMAARAAACEPDDDPEAAARHASATMGGLLRRFVDLGALSGVVAGGN